MKSFLLAFFSLITSSAFAQNAAINNHTYYSYYVGPTSMKGDVVGPIDKLKSKRLNSNWLRSEEITPIVVEEMKKAGYGKVSATCLYRLDSAKYVVLTAHSYTSNVGFLYSAGHSALPSKEARQPQKLTRAGSQFDYVQNVRTIAGSNEWIRVKKLPTNIIVLAEDWYWYQYTDDTSDNNYLVTKEDIIRVLRQDIQEKLEALPKPKTR